MNKRQQKKFWKSGRLILKNRHYSKKLRTVYVAFNKCAIPLDEYVKNMDNIIKYSIQFAEASK